MFLLDTNVVSEWAKPQPNVGVVTWLDETDEDRLYMSVASIAELRYGVERVAAGRRRNRLREWLDRELTVRFQDRILPIDLDVAHAYAEIVASREEIGHPIAIMDAFIAATARVHELTVVTRNAGDFDEAAESILNPWV
jgi:predicted nucleic acid-binding protein